MRVRLHRAHISVSMLLLWIAPRVWAAPQPAPKSTGETVVETLDPEKPIEQIDMGVEDKNHRPKSGLNKADVQALSLEKKKFMVDGYVDELDKAIELAKADLNVAREAKDIIQVTCVQVGMKRLKRSYADTKKAALAVFKAIANGNDSLADQHFMDATGYYKRGRRIFSEIGKCIGQTDAANQQLGSGINTDSNSEGDSSSGSSSPSGGGVTDASGGGGAGASTTVTGPGGGPTVPPVASRI